MYSIQNIKTICNYRAPHGIPIKIQRIQHQRSRQQPEIRFNWWTLGSLSPNRSQGNVAHMPDMLLNSAWLPCRMLQVREDFLQKRLRKGCSVRKSCLKSLPYMQTLTLDQEVTDSHHLQTHVRLIKTSMQDLPITKFVFASESGQINDKIRTDWPFRRET